MKFEKVLTENSPETYKINQSFEFIDPRFSFEKYNVFCDMDGVITDMVKQYFDLCGKDLEDPLTNKKWYKILDEIPKTEKLKFWSDMPWLSDGKVLWNYIRRVNPCILTSPCISHSCMIGKREWVRRELGENVCIIVAIKKHLVFNEPSLKGKILIDDKEKKILPWREMGGIGILHKNAEDTIAQLKEIGQ